MKRMTRLAITILGLSAVGCGGGGGDGGSGGSSGGPAPGSLVPSFGNGGVVTEKFAGGNVDLAFAVAVDASALYVAGLQSMGGAPGWRVESRNGQTGGLNWSVLAVDVTDKPVTGYATAIAADGTGVYVAGVEGMKWRIEKRALTDGNLNKSFGKDGVVLAEAGSGRPFAAALHKSKGVLCVVGSATGGTTETQALVLVNSTTGGAEALASKPGAFQAVCLYGDYLYAAGYEVDASGKHRWSGVRTDLTAPVELFPTAPPEGEVTGIACDSTGLSIVGFQTLAVGNSQWRIERRMPDAQPMATFGNLGVIALDPTPNLDSPTAVAVDGSLWIVGSENTKETSPSDARWRIERRNLFTGSLDYPLLSDPSSQDDVAAALALSSDALFVVGADGAAGPDKFQWRIEKRFR